MSINFIVSVNLLFTYVLKKRKIKYGHHLIRTRKHGKLEPSGNVFGIFSPRNLPTLFFMSGVRIQLFIDQQSPPAVLEVP